ncbi:hypothetical protein ACUY1T_14710 [Billgrantia sp. Q4P2]|uniref:hypothetical protein n=1 Tax=Billgrantia sp. Q4P2 TaxID=3463857 RepID=UPI004055BB32
MPPFEEMSLAAILLLLAASSLFDRHLLRRLLAFNIIGTGIFLILMSLVGQNAMAAAHGLVVTGLLVALLGTALGALLIRRLERLEQAGEMTSAKGNRAS